MWSCFFKIYTSYDNEIAETAFDNALSGSQYDNVIPVYPENILEEIKENDRQHALIELSIQNILTETINSNEIIESLKLISENNIRQDNFPKLITSIFQKQEIVLPALHSHIIETLSLDDALVGSAKVMIEFFKNNQFTNSKKYSKTCLFQTLNFVADKDLAKTKNILKAYNYISSYPSYITVNGRMATIDKTTYIDPLDISYYCIMSDIKDWLHNLFHRNNKI